MGGWYLARREGDPDLVEERLLRVEQHFRQQGFAQATRFETATHICLTFPYLNGGPILHCSAGSDWIAVAGTLFYDGVTGPIALERLLADFRFPFSNWDRISGHFALVVSKGGTVHVLTDFFGAFQIFHNADFGTVSTSFLSIAAELPKAQLDTQAVYELVLNVFPTGDSTILEEVRRLGPDKQLALDTGNRVRAVQNRLPDRGKWTPDHRQMMIACLKDRVAEAVTAWGGNVQAPLTAGLDSRLLYALLRDAGVQPYVYIYGNPGEVDVDIPQMIADAEGFSLDVFDKASWPAVAPDAFADIVRANFHAIDGIATDGSLFDTGANKHARQLRSAGGALAASGGCGEVFRNFFYLPDGPMDARDIVRAFFSRYDPRDLTDAFSERRYEREMTDKIKTALMVRSGRISRKQVDEVYPRVRCRAFFGREISIVGRHGGYLMPFYDHHLVSWSLNIPQPLRRVGRLQAEILTEIDPKLASYMSGYGHSFDAPTSRKAYWNEKLSSMRPPIIRKHMYRLRNRLLSHDDEGADMLAAEYLGRVIDLDYPTMRRFFNMDHVRDPNMIRRIAKLEYFAAWMGGRLE